jgi:phosphomannomutase
MGADSLKFGTSGLRGLAVELEGQAARRYVVAFLHYLALQGGLANDLVYLGRDFRASSPAITADCAAAVAAHGLQAIDCGEIPTPALACHAMANGSPAIMITGSHIPGDRNGLKFYTPGGEISKADEAEILAALTDDPVPDSAQAVIDEHAVAVQRYLARFASLIAPGALQGWRLGVFEHSSVARDILGAALVQAGAEVVRLGRVERFVAVDTEAVNDGVFAPLRGWIASERLDAIVSSDGDGDRPLLMDGRGNFVRGDVLGLLAARFLRADAVVTPVTSNSAIERTGLFGTVLRTRVGSPFVVAGIDDAIGQGCDVVVGFEANGGTLLGTDTRGAAGTIAALPTRDAILPLLCVLGLAAGDGVSVAELVAGLPLQHALSDRIEHVPSAKSGALLGQLAGDAGFAKQFFAPDHAIDRLDRIDGLQFWLSNGEMVHLRASGNAPELRCYVESGSEAGARALLDWGMARAMWALTAY